jgi:Asp-tRNA(Asn)/Glu-tRNA(Gln) amidotransferase A subunit family amidase
MGSLLFENFVPNEDAYVIERVREAGGIIFGKTNTPEFGMNRRSINLVSREALNPWDPARQRSSGGSSGGSGVAVAAGLGPISIGTDGGGSIRIPSSFNGIFGLFPTRGLTPHGPDIFDAPTSGIGPMARDVRDAALLLHVMAGPDERDPFSRGMRQPPDYVAELEKGVKGLRVAWSSDFGRIQPDHPEVVDVCHALAITFKELGAIYNEPNIRLTDPHDPLERDREITMEKLTAEVRKMKGDYSDVMGWMKKLPPEQYAKLAIYLRDRSDRPTQLDYAMGIPPAIRNKPVDRLCDVFKRYDLLLSPVIARTAFVAGELGISPFNYTAYTFLANVAGYCGCSVPAGFVDGMPVGLHIMGRPGDEALLLRAARALEKARPWAQHRPHVN